LADKDKKKKKSGISNNSANYYYVSAGGTITGRSTYRDYRNYRDAERYRERARREGSISQKYPNRRRKIITGKDLTTPLKGRARVTEHKKIIFKTKTVAVPKEKMMWALLLKLFVGAAALCWLIYSYIVLFEADYNINMMTDKIKAEQIEMRVLERELEIENDPTEILRIARDEYGMVDEFYIQKHYIRSRREDRVVIAEKNNRFIPEIVIAFFSSDKSE
jgi:hypothetical protein